MTDELLRANARDSEHLEVARELGLASYMCVPLIATGAPLGTVSLLSAGSGRHFGPTDLPICEELARRSAFAIERARLYQREHAAARTLQRSLLPLGLPDVPGVSMAVRYLPGGDGLEVGGDWYDAFPLPGGALGVVMGDVIGRGVRAASVMGQMRSALRAYAFQGDGPGVVLGRLDRMVKAVDDEELVTLIHLQLDVAAGRLRIANAGHMPPLIVGSGGEARFLEEPHGPPLGAPGAELCADAWVELHRGTTLVLYTDGLVEHRGADIDMGLQKVRDVSVAHADDDPATLCDELLDATGGTGPQHDDIAVMVLTMLPEEGPIPAAGTTPGIQVT
jgi:serine/threonine-protein kinase RsbW